MQIAEKWQLPPFRLGMCTDEEPLVELRSSRLAGLIGPIQRELFGDSEAGVAVWGGVVDSEAGVAVWGGGVSK